MTKYFNSGLHKAFYITHTIDISKGVATTHWIEYNYPILAEYYKHDLDLEYRDETDRQQQTDQIFWDNLTCTDVYFEPLVLSEVIALECGLTPFNYKRIPMLALSGSGMNLTPRLEAYQLLTHSTIDKDSPFFSTANKSPQYFESAVGKQITEKLLLILGQ